MALVQPVLSPVVNTVLSPVVNAVLSPVVNGVLSPVVNGVLSPVVNEVLSPVVNGVLSPVVNAVLSPVVNGVLSPVLPQSGDTDASAVDSLPFAVATFLTAVRLLAKQSNIVMQRWPREANINDGDKFDFVIVGGGTAGCVLANRLTEENNTVLLIEAGSDPPIERVIPGLFFVFPHTRYDYDFHAEDDHRSSQLQKLQAPALTSGKMLGGSSSLSHLVWTRGKRVDYDSWNSDLWKWDTVLEYFKKSESMIDKSVLYSKYAKYHGTKGPVSLEGHNNRAYYKREDNILKAIQDVGNERLDSINGPDDIGYAKAEFTTDDGARSSPFHSYLLPAARRNNLVVMRNTLATKVIIDKNNEAIGVEVKTRRHNLKIYTNKEVVLSAGAYNSPKLLMLSGVGPKDELRKFNIVTKMDLPVGEGWMDHVTVPLAFRGETAPLSTTQPVLASLELGTFPLPAVQGLLNLTDESNPTIQHVLTNYGALSPLLFITCTMTFNYKPEFCAEMITQNPFNEVLFTLVSLLHPRSRGRVRLRSSNPEDPPVFEAGFLSDQRDKETLAKGLIKAALTGASYYKRIRSEVIKLPVPECDIYEFQSMEYWRCYAENCAASQFSSTGTCGMRGVVDDRLRVHGIKKLRVVDASVLPNSISGQILAATLMVAERAADFIKEDHSKS